MCLTNKALLTFFDRRREKRLSFVNIRDDNYSPSKHGGVSYADAMRHFHVIDGDHVAEGSEAILTAYTKVGLGWLMAVLRFPLIRWLVDGLYAVISRHRYTSKASHSLQPATANAEPIGSRLFPPPLRSRAL